ncbi:ribosomal-protein-alanine acetyltransferase [Synechocystis sp. PCC 6803]|uniref:Ribosomal-protein-alanine acetyltransferase n=1 Tax=Synechocystis sp. (strain ATCC 27184 / PCC 6803 / Kazusa) TaxID=1111708 RepID=P73741_SYNY3|nr:MULTISPECIES: ribosomal protein S18-alanine N-acetyltransferase [unclassified Synechocystis]BAM51541.1 ribosomal-protein-alanine acetyltransferase [Synechocystis sp. PCC 6803] [Bacillus subtilis BEST7613]AGF51477.1 ribosomal-protein-alanine acetyltransferase [Synechocystis sp. PCC 6803]ALJ67481.1 ribosomal-protein-alanine acetyltransferase [Synechocystis sp. PCC 6803]AVP89328.1 ribosomal-protein-alanine N-acetyltransferase [Synechocystis sp. IPPAS B-1465]MBD2617465.1 ribosomal protein S18-a
MVSLLGPKYDLFWPHREELPQFAQLDQQCLGGMWTLAGYEREWDSDHSVLLGIRLIARGNLVAMGAFWQILEEAHITLLAVAQAHRRQGLGKILLQNLLATAEHRQLERATLEVRASNQAAMDLYHQFGFQLAGCRKRYYPDGEDALILWKNHLSSPA